MDASQLTVPSLKFKQVMKSRVLNFDQVVGNIILESSRKELEKIFRALHGY